MFVISILPDQSISNEGYLLEHALLCLNTHSYAFAEGDLFLSSYAFMEFDCVANGKKIVEYFNSQRPFEVDGKMLLVDFAKNTYKTM